MAFTKEFWEKYRRGEVQVNWNWHGGTPEAREAQSAVMTRNLNEYWAKVHAGEIEMPKYNRDFCKTEEHRKLLSERLRGKKHKPVSPEGLARRGKAISEAFKRRPRQVGQNLRNWQEKVRSGEIIDPRKGRTLTEEEKEKQRQTTALNKLWKDLLSVMI